MLHSMYHVRPRDHDWAQLPRKPPRQRVLGRETIPTVSRTVGRRRSHYVYLAPAAGHLPRRFAGPALSPETSC